MVFLQVLADEAGGDLVEPPGGGRSVVVAEAVEGALGDAKVELDDAPSAVSLFADDLGQGWVFLSYLSAGRLVDFWPRGGTVWDGLARTSRGRRLLMEAKAEVPLDAIATDSGSGE